MMYLRESILLRATFSQKYGQTLCRKLEGRLRKISQSHSDDHSKSG